MASVMPASHPLKAVAPAKHKVMNHAYGSKLLVAVDSVPEIHGIGVKVAEGGRIVTVRGSIPSEPFMLIELRPPLRLSKGTAPAAPVEPKVDVGKE